MAGPLARVGTIVGAINLDVSRKLNWGNDIVLEFITVDRSVVDGWAVLYTLDKGFDRIIDPDENFTGTSAYIVFEVADKIGDLLPILLTKDLCLRVDDVIYTVVKVPDVAESEAKIYRLMCKIKPIRGPFNHAR